MYYIAFAQSGKTNFMMFMMRKGGIEIDVHVVHDVRVQQKQGTKRFKNQAKLSAVIPLSFPMSAAPVARLRSFSIEFAFILLTYRLVHRTPPLAGSYLVISLTYILDDPY